MNLILQGHKAKTATGWRWSVTYMDEVVEHGTARTLSEVEQCISDAKQAYSAKMRAKRYAARERVMGSLAKAACRQGSPRQPISQVRDQLRQMSAYVVILEGRITAALAMAKAVDLTDDARLFGVVSALQGQKAAD